MGDKCNDKWKITLVLHLQSNPEG